MRVIVMGGSVTGLTVALLLTRDGHEVTVVDRGRAGLMVAVLGAAAAVPDGARAAARILRRTAGVTRVRRVSAPVPPADPLADVLDLLTGTPTCGMVWQALGLPCDRLDSDGPGWIVALPQVPLAYGCVVHAMRIWQEAARRYHLPAAAEIILASPHTAHMVVQITFARRDSLAAHTLRDALIGRFAAAGMPAYRTDIDHVALDQPDGLLP